MQLQAGLELWARRAGAVLLLEDDESTPALAARLHAELLARAAPSARRQSGGLVPLGRGGARAACREDKPILLSVGYAACHWCHVMEHESFEDEETAALMNERFVCVKVDREERPDLDGSTWRRSSR